MRAVVLVGGLGTRLQPLTFTTPKQMLPVAGVPMIERVLAQLAPHGVDSAVLSLGYRPDAFAAAYPDGRCAGVAVHYAVEPEPLDTAGAVRFAALHAAIDERFVVVNGDVLTDLDLGALVRQHDERGAEGTIALHRVDDPSRFGVVASDARGRVRAFVEKPSPGEAPSDLINAGTYVLERSVVDRIPADRRVSIERETFPALAGEDRLFAMASDAYWIDAGTPAQYLQASLDYLDGRRGEIVSGVSPDAAVAPGARVDRSVLGAGVLVEEGAVVESSVLLPGVRVGPGASVRWSIVGPRAVVSSGAKLEELTVVGDDVVVGPATHLSGARLPEEAA